MLNIKEKTSQSYSSQTRATKFTCLVMHRDVHLSYKRCSSKLQEIQRLENFVSMAIQDTQVPMYTKHTLFLYFFDFFLIFILKNKINKTESKKRHVKQSKV